MLQSFQSTEQIDLTVKRFHFYITNHSQMEFDQRIFYLIFLCWFFSFCFCFRKICCCDNRKKKSNDNYVSNSDQINDVINSNHIEPSAPSHDMILIYMPNCEQMGHLHGTVCNRYGHGVVDHETVNENNCSFQNHHLDAGYNFN